MDFEAIFKALGEATRIRIIKLLSYKPMYVCELEAILQISQPRISQHLKILRAVDVVEMEKEGQRVVYSLNKSNMDLAFSLFNNFLQCPLEELDDFKEESHRIILIEDDPLINTCKLKCSKE
ncbi:ArsR/SmtB family transcription factor [Alkaliphilus peptidifermentans]|uniref:Transcriptional regulator, ArsR family n=1 Tax=Alkaliphilus peptidifermentans DSM 18978 TaxID=1120976 RepID=A0A1G5AK07_9FIRM|nr:metalloregulator ArsR/SmtB family transcription factor [Alkaliphilus peptidifermentans]SCX78246.1 transcriptional regulator, ArsR family [Alkaliphilus peptidifermentans DSM 18978]